jgi:hypothetical protein
VTLRTKKSVFFFLEAVLKIRKSFEKQMDHGFGVFRVDFVVTIEATGKRPPGKHRRRPVDQFADIAAIGKDFLKAGDQAGQDGAPADD